MSASRRPCIRAPVANESGHTTDGERTGTHPGAFDHHVTRVKGKGLRRVPHWRKRQIPRGLKRVDSGTLFDLDSRRSLSEQQKGIGVDKHGFDPYLLLGFGFIGIDK